MLLGKRARHPMKRTTSMTEFSFEDLTIIPRQQQPSSDQLPPIVDRDRSRDHHRNHNQNLSNQRVMAMVSPRPIGRRNSADFASVASNTFLTTCSLCNRRLVPGRDIYMYRGDSAFCSLECRHQQMAEDEKREKEKDKCSASASTTSLVKESNSSHSHSQSQSQSRSSPAGSHVSSANNETVAAL